MDAMSRARCRALAKAARLSNVASSPASHSAHAMISSMPRVAVGLAGFAAMMNMYAPQAVLPILADEFGVGPAGISQIMTVSALAVAITAPFTGAIADVAGRRRVIALAMVLLVVPDV